MWRYGEGEGGLCNTFACVNCWVADHGSADKCSKMALFKQSLIFLKRLLWTFMRRAEDEMSASCLLTVEHYSADANLIFTVGRWNYEWTYYFMYIWENVQSHESKCTIPKRISSCLVIFWSAMQSFLHYFFRIVFHSVATHNISLFYCLKSIFSCVNIQEDILCQNAKIQ